jgi:integrase
MWTKRGIYQLYIPRARARCVQRSTMTSDRRVALAMRRIVRRLASARRWDVLEALLCPSGDTRRRTLGDLYDAYRRDPSLRAFLPPAISLRLADHLATWRTDLFARGRRPFTVEVYEKRVGQFLRRVERRTRCPATVADVNRAAVKEWLGSLLELEPCTRRSTFYALKSFVRHLIEEGALPWDPLAGMRAPEKGAPRMRYESEETDRRVVDAASDRWRAFFAFVHATGAEVSPALAAPRRDIDLARGVARVRGTKTPTRDRHVVIEPWALPYLRAHCEGVAADALLWPERSRYAAHGHHERICAELGLAGYTLRDARHSVAVRARRRGMTFEWIAAQLGHKNAYLAATCYAAFQPDVGERVAVAAAAVRSLSVGTDGDPAVSEAISPLARQLRTVANEIERLAGGRADES